MSKFKMIISWFLVIATIMLSFVLFPLFSSTLPNYIGDEYYHDIYKPKTISTEKYIDEVFPWQYYDESKTTIYQNSDVIDDMEKQAESFLKSTMFSDMILSLDFSQQTKLCGSDYLYVHNYKLIVDRKEYVLNLSYDITNKLIVMLHCDSGGVFDRNIIADGETHLKRLVEEYVSSIQYSGGNYFYDDIHTVSNSIWEYLLIITPMFTDIDIFFAHDDSIKLALDNKIICVSDTNGSITLFWNPNSRHFEGYSINIDIFKR